MMADYFQSKYGNYPITRILDVLNSSNFDISCSEISKKAKVSRNTTTKILNDLCDRKTVLRTRKIYNGQYYRLLD